jgi:hypothetical protein
LGSSSVGPSTERVRLMFDTNMGNDIDDCLALGEIHALDDQE